MLNIKEENYKYSAENFTQICDKIKIVKHNKYPYKRFVLKLSV